MEKKLILKINELLYNIQLNSNCLDDDLEATWESMKNSYDEVKKLMDNYIKRGEK